MHVDNADIEAFGPQLLCRFDGVGEHYAAGDNISVAALHELNALAKAEFIITLIDLGLVSAICKADVFGPIKVCGRFKGLDSLGRISRHAESHPWKGAQDRQIFHGVMC